MRRRYTRDLAGVDAVVWGIPFDAAVSNRPGARFGPQAIRRASAIFDGDPQYPFGVDPFATLAVVDYGDCSLRLRPAAEIPAAIEAAGRGDPRRRRRSSSRSAATTSSPIRCSRRMPRSTGRWRWSSSTRTRTPGRDDGDRIDHGTFVGRAVARGPDRPGRSIQIGIRTHAPEDCGIEIVTRHDVDAARRRAASSSAIRARVGEARPISPSTSTASTRPSRRAPARRSPAACRSREALAILRGLGAIDFVGGDVVEVSPPYDHADITAIAAATVAMYYLGLLAERRRGD